MRVRWFSRRKSNPPVPPHHAAGTHRTVRPRGANPPYRLAAPSPVRPVNLPTWMTQPTVANPQVGRVGWLTPAQQWRANGGRW